MKTTKFQAVGVASEGAALNLILVNSTVVTVICVEHDVQRQLPRVFVMATELDEFQDQRGSWSHHRRAFLTSAQEFRKDLPEPEV